MKYDLYRGRPCLHAWDGKEAIPPRGDTMPAATSPFPSWLLFILPSCLKNPFSMSSPQSRRARQEPRLDLSSKTRGGAFWLFGFMVQGGFEVQRGFIAEGRVCVATTKTDS